MKQSTNLGEDVAFSHKHMPNKEHSQPCLHEIDVDVSLDVYQSL